MELTQESTPALLAQILGELRKQRVGDDLWGAEEIADFLKIGKKSVQSHILGSDGFPENITLPSGGRRWLAKEVKAWAIKRR